MGQKGEFLRTLTYWIELTPQTAYALTTTLRVHAVLRDDLLRLFNM